MDPTSPPRAAGAADGAALAAAAAAAARSPNRPSRANSIAMRRAAAVSGITCSPAMPGVRSAVATERSFQPRAYAAAAAAALPPLPPPPLPPSAARKSATSCCTAGLWPQPASAAQNAALPADESIGAPASTRAAAGTPRRHASAIQRSNASASSAGCDRKTVAPASTWRLGRASGQFGLVGGLVGVLVVFAFRDAESDLSVALA
eukprot:352917-Chlamydomonas_euryale.AAC.9